MKITGIQLIAEFHGCPPHILNDSAALKNILTDGIDRCGFHQVNLSSHQFEPIGVTLVSIINESHISIHTFPEGRHASIDIFHCSDNVKSLFKLLEYLKEELKPNSVIFMQITRGSTLRLRENNVMTSLASHGLEVRYHYRKKLAEKHSKFHKIEVIDHDSFGRMLFINGDLQLAETDVHIYNKAMITPLIHSRKMNQVAILGGGDGGVLHALLALHPQKVYLVDIDSDVIAVAKEYFPGVCGDGFDRSNVNIVIDDASKFLQRTGPFDAIIYDLTMEPVGTYNKPKGFLQQMISQIYRSLNEDGILSMQCCSKFDQGTFKLISGLLSKHFRDVQYSTVFIPSFCEPWIFASARR